MKEVLALATLMAVTIQPLPAAIGYPVAASAVGSPSISQITATEQSEVDRRIVETRDLALYDDGGTFVVGYGLGAGTYLTEESPEYQEMKRTNEEARLFIWEHWTQRRRGYIRIVFQDADFSSAAHLFIEPNNQGTWSIAWRAVREKHKILDAHPIVAVKRVELELKDRWYFLGNEIPDNVEMGPSTYALIFVYSTGEQSRPF